MYMWFRENLYLLSSLVTLFEGGVKKVWITVLSALVIISLILNYIDIAWVKWPLTIMMGGGFFYAIYDDFAQHVREKTIEILIKREEQKKGLADGTYDVTNSFFKKSNLQIFWSLIRLCIYIILVYFLLTNLFKNKNEISQFNYGITYDVVSKEKLDKVCRSEDRCSTTVKKTMTSSDGFVFETYISDGPDSVWCIEYRNDSFLESYNPCSTIGDNGGGGENIVVVNKKNGASTTIIGNGIQLKRIATPEEYPYLIFVSASGGASTPPMYVLYNKNDLTFVSESRKNKYSELN